MEKVFNCLESIDKPAYIKPKIDAIIIDEPELVQINHPESSVKTLSRQLVNKIITFCQNANRINIVFDVYQENSLENDIRESRSSGEGTRTLVRHNTLIQQKKFNNFLIANSQNRTIQDHC